MSHRIKSFLGVIVTYNEESRIASTINFYQSHIDNFLLIDNFSTDSTLDIALNILPQVKIIQYRNTGTTETCDWWIHVSSYFTHDYVLFLSCSERISIDLLKVYDHIAQNKSTDIVFSPRTTITSGVCTDSLYCTPSSLFTLHNKLPQVARFVRWQSIDPSYISPHDSFRSQVKCSKYSTLHHSSDLTILHLRPKPCLSFSNAKIISYAQSYANSCRIQSPIFAVLDSFARASLDSARFFRLIIIGDFSNIIFREFVLRLYLHFLVVVFSVFRKVNR